MIQRLSLALLFLIPAFAPAQIPLWVKGNNTAEFDCYVNAYGGFPKKGKANFLLHDLRLGIEGSQGIWLDYKIQVDVANLLYSPKINPLLDAKIDIDLPNQFNIIAGYQSLPFSFNSMVGFRQSPFFQRTTLADGNLFVRREMGLLLEKKAFKSRFNGFAGVFGGSGNLNPFHSKGGIALVARAGMSFPARLKYDEIDIRQSPFPRVSFGANALFSSQHTDSLVFGLPLLVNGKKWISGVDATFAYQGFSLQGEWNYAHISPSESTTGYKKNYHVSGGFCSGNYYFRTIRTTFAFRYETYRVFQPGIEVVNAARVAVNYFLDQSQRRIIRLDYCFHSTYEEENLRSGLGKGVRLGLQLGL
jgi:hypothetical protein